MKLWIGTSGYSYKPWLGKFYPERLAAKEMLRFYSTKLPAVEINNTFYRLPKQSVLESWAAQVPDDFRFVLKSSQRITHIKRLQDAGSELEYFFRVAAVMGGKIGATLFQLPPNLKKDIDRLKKFLALLPPGQRIAFEFRHPSWSDEEVFKCLRERDAALCFAEFEEDQGRDIVPTASWGYIRLRRPDYESEDLAKWKSRIAAQNWDQAYVFFKHEDEGIGPRLAAQFLDLAHAG